MSRTSHARPKKKREPKCPCGWAMCWVQVFGLGLDSLEEKRRERRWKLRKKEPITD